LNINFQVISFTETSNSLLNNNSNYISCPNFFQKSVKTANWLSLITSKVRSDYFIIYSNNYSICLQINCNDYENNILTINAPCNSFEDFLYTLKYYQIHYTDIDSTGLFEKIHMYLLTCMKDFYLPSQDGNVPNEILTNIFNLFIKFVRIFRSINQIHETNLTIISYLIGISNDYFFFLLTRKY